MLSADELIILGVSAADIQGEFVTIREYNKPWGKDYADIKNLESLGFMKFKSAERISQTKQFSRRSVITEAGRGIAARPPT
jgi:hypothetical protein